MCVFFCGAHKSLAPRARTLLGGLGQATLSFFAVATLLFFYFCECPKFWDLAKQRHKMFWGVSEVGKDDFSLYFIWLCNTRQRARGGRRGSEKRETSPRTKAPQHTTHHHAPTKERRHHASHTQPHQVGCPNDGRLEVPAPQTHRPAPTASSQQTPPTCPNNRQQGERERLTQMPLTPVRGSPPGDALPPTPKGATPAGKSAHCGAADGYPRPHQPRSEKTGNGAWLGAPRMGSRERESA